MKEMRITELWFGDLEVGVPSYTSDEWMES